MEKDVPIRVFWQLYFAGVLRVIKCPWWDRITHNSPVVCALSQKDVKDVFAAMAFEVAYSLGKHVLTGQQDRDLPPLTPVLRWRKGQKIAVRNEVKPNFS